jgi:hypothetical protein
MDHLAEHSAVCLFRFDSLCLAEVDALILRESARMRFSGMTAIRGRAGKSLFARDCVVGLRGN